MFETEFGKRGLARMMKNYDLNRRKAHILAGIEYKLIVINKQTRILIYEVKMLEN